MKVLSNARNAFSTLTRRSPYFRGLGRAYQWVNKACLHFGVAPLAKVPMKDGTNMLVDLRAVTELHAFYRGEYDPECIAAVKSLLDEHSWFLDVGANVGFFTVAITSHRKALHSKGMTIAFEPLPSNYARLQANITNNNLDDRCLTFPIGLSNRTCEAEITLREDFKSGSSTGNASLTVGESIDAGFQRERVQLDSLDHIWPTLAPQGIRVGVIKLDIEGHEDFFLDGASSLLDRDRPIIFTEINKPYYQVRGVDIDALFSPLLPAQYLLLRNPDGIWKVHDKLSDCAEAENIIWMPAEKFPLLGAKLNGERS
jgi:FkbM family methyltransferase